MTYCEIAIVSRRPTTFDAHEREAKLLVRAGHVPRKERWSREFAQVSRDWMQGNHFIAQNRLAALLKAGERVPTDGASTHKTI